MKIPRLEYWDNFYITSEYGRKQLTPEDVVVLYNQLADRYDIVLADIEEIVSGYQRGTDNSVHQGIANTA